MIENATARAASLVEEARRILDEQAGSDPDADAMRIACDMAIAVVAPSRRRTIPLATWGPASGRSQKWMIHFEDQDRPLIVYDASLYGEAQAELLARRAFDMAKDAWNCTLFKIADLKDLDGNPA